MPQIQRPPGRDVTVRNTEGFIYLIGDNDTDGSLRLIPDLFFKDQFEFQKRAVGVWNDTGIQIAASTIYLGRELRLSAAGEWLFTRDTGEDLKALSPHIEFTEEFGSDPYALTPILSPLIENIVAQPDDSGQLTIGSTVFTYEPDGAPFRTLAKSFRLRFWQQATANMIIDVRRGSPTGEIFFRQVYPKSKLAPGEEIFEIDGLIEADPDENFHIQIAADVVGGEIYMLADVTLTMPWLSIDAFLQTTEQIMTSTVGMDRVLIGMDGNCVSDESGNLVLDGEGTPP